ncbi:phospholipid transfer protein-like [Parambassis ranga]|uniref:Bactericidal permeability-increasing protein n=1 Tax=Parambassis ranga TaxID=210632 RepID=A0A6P7IXE3_9TELE|nr:phospholipid transfer protein-like [Parambassis ranga]
MAVDPTGIKLRVTDGALDVLKDAGLAFLESLVNTASSDVVDLWIFKITWVKIISIEVNPDGVALHFQENSGVQLEIKNLDFTVDLEYEAIFQKHRTTIEGFSVDANLGVELSWSEEEHLKADLLTCTIGAGGIKTSYSGITGDVINYLLTFYVKNKFCGIVNSAVPPVNSMLERISQPVKLHEGLNISMDCSLSSNIAVASHSIDTALKGMVFREGETYDIHSVRAGEEPVFSECDRAVYVGISEFFFNSAAMMLYKWGPFQLDIPEKTEELTIMILESVGLPQGAVQVKLSEVPIISISKNGLSADVRVRAHSVDQPDRKPLPVMCQLNMMVDVKGSHLVLISKDVKCEIHHENTISSALVNIGLEVGIESILESWFDKGVQLPLPEGLGLTQEKVEYHDGFLVARGTLKFTKHREADSSVLTA